MEKFILAEKLKEEIAGQKLRAAVFHSFNFDPDFFENYLLPLFLPDIPFGDNAIQNTILWRKFQEELPPITVYCDFHAKAKKGINLDYLVRPLDIKRQKDSKPCYHPKHSFIVLQDWTLLVITGSNNLTEAAWCSNLEGVNFFRFKSKINYPRKLKDSFRDFSRKIRSDFNLEISDAEEMLERFFKSQGYTDPAPIEYFDSTQWNINNQLAFGMYIESIKEKNNGNKPFRKVEVVSPYFSAGISLFNSLKEITQSEDISLSIPFDNTDLVAMDEKLFKEVQGLDFQWKHIVGMRNVKGHRFNHSKIYKLLGEENSFTIVGSVNFTEMAWKGVRNGGNYESAIMYTEPKDKWQDILEPYPLDNLDFTGYVEEEKHKVDTREDVYNLEFILDWGQETLRIINADPENQKGKVVFENASNILLGHEDSFPLSKQQIQELNNSTLIKVKPSNKNTHYYYYPTQLNIGSKPLPEYLNLNDAELLMLWSELDDSKNRETSLRIIDRFIDRITDESGDIIPEQLKQSSSTLNLMATHLSGLLGLHKKLYTAVRTLREKAAIEKMRNYYLFTNNVDTLIGYQSLLKKMIDDGKLNKGFYWLLLSIIDKYFYLFEKDLETCEDDRKLLIEKQRKVLKGDLRLTEKALKESDVSDKHLRWASKILEDDFK